MDDDARPVATPTTVGGGELADPEQPQDVAPADVVAPPTLISVLQQFGPRFALEAAAPVGLFLVVNTTLGLVWAITAATVWAVGLMIVRRRSGRRGSALLWFSLVFVLLRGAAGIVTRSDVVYFGPAVANNFLIAIVFAGSVVFRRPILCMVAPIFYPFSDEMRSHRAYRRVFGRLTLAWAALLAASGSMQVALLATTTTNTYLLVRSFVAWPLSLALFVYSLRYPRIAFAREPDLFDQVAEAEGAMVRRNRREA